MSDRRTIVIVDDVALFRELGGLFLSRTGRILSASSGEEGLDLVRREKPDLVITDFQMPGGSGLELATRLRKNADTAAVPLIMLTARGEIMDRVVGLELGADDFIVKPFGVKEVVAAPVRSQVQAGAGA